MTKLTLYAYPGADNVPSFSPVCTKAVLALARSGLDYTLEPVTGDPAKVSPTKRLPALKIGSEVLSDSVRILDRLQDLNPPQAFWHDDPSDRVWEHFANDTLYWKAVYLRWCVPENVKRTKAALLGGFNAILRATVGRLIVREVIGRAKGQGTGLKSHDDVLADLGRALDLVVAGLDSGPFLGGAPEPGRGDLALGGLLPQLTLGGLTPRGAELVHARPDLAPYTARIYEACGLPVPTGLQTG